MTLDKVRLIKRENFNSSELIDLLASHDTLLKKLTCDYLVDKCTIDSNLSLLTANILLRDCNDANPALRGASLLALSNLPGMEEASISAVSKAMGDSSPQVRRMASHCCVSIFHHAPEACLGSGLVDLLYEGIRDPDPICIVNCLVALEDLLSREGGLILNRNIVHHLLDRTAQFSDCNIVYILTLLLNYYPRTQDETFYILDRLDTCLGSSCPSVLMAAIKLFLLLTKEFPNLVGDLYDAVNASFCKVMSQSRPELCYALLDFLHQSPPELRSKFGSQFKFFLVRSKDPSYLKEKKFEFLPLVATKENVCDILSEVKPYTSDFQSYGHAFRCLGLLGASFDVSCEQEVFSIVASVVRTSNDKVTEAALRCLLAILLRQEADSSPSERALDLPETLCQAVSSALTRPSLQESCPDLLLQTLHFVSPFVSSILQDLLEELSRQEESWAARTRCAFVSLCCVAFLHHPALLQPVLAAVLCKSLKATDRRVAGHAAFAYAALEEGPSQALRLLSLSGRPSPAIVEGEGGHEPPPVAMRRGH